MLKLPPDKKGVFLKNFVLLPEEKRYLSKKEIEKIKVITYKVKRGDNLWNISRKFRVSVRQVKKWNNLRSNRIYPNQRIKIYPYRI
ncbi:LysM peptidoglycan-binding domain-containing protein [bacterium]|nr:LysM peptidoglycan-binding domain-containing protein [bacterium]